MSSNFDIEQERRFAEEVDASRLRRTWIGCILALILWPAGIILDMAGHPDMFWPLVRCRLFCITVVGLVAIWLKLKKLTHNQSIVASWIWGLAPAFAISWMVVITTGSESPFYAGLNLVILGTCILMPFTGEESAVYCLTVYASYIAAIYLHEPTPFSKDYFIMHSTFIIMTATICVTFSHFSFVSRQQDFLLRETLRLQNEQLSNIDRTKTEFFANVSHELRTPMTLILAPLEQIMQDLSSFPQPVQSTIALVQRNAHRLIHLIDDLLDLVRFERVREISKKETVDVTALLRALVESFQWTAKQNSVALSFECDDTPASIEGDIHQLERVFINLLSNAIKFTPANGTILVVTKASAGMVLVEVADSGTGIPSDHIDKIFDRYYQSTAANSRAIQGLGIGLALVKQIVELHGGKVSVKSRSDQGSTFSVLLPMSASTPSNRGTLEPSDRLLKYAAQNQTTMVTTNRSEIAPNPDRPLVLVLDDEEDMLVFVSDILRRKFNVISFKSAVEAKTWLSESKLSPEVIVSDLMMPTIDGMSFARWARDVEGLSSTRILMVTARIDDAVKLEALNSGVDDFMTKPFSALELESRVTNLSANVQLQKGLAESNTQLERAYTQLKNAEAQLIQSEKMNSLGTLSAGLLHEINNPLNHMMMAVNYCQGIVTQVGVGERTADVNETFDDINLSMKRIGSIITDLREFAYPDTASAMSPFSLKRAVTSAIRFTRSETVGMKLIDNVNDSAQVTGSEQQIVQVLVNLLMNASYAVTRAYPGDGGIIRITSSLDTSGTSISIQVDDNGPGISPDHMEQLFDPFFTTKPVGEGMGLGLSICHSILQRHNSSFRVLRTSDGFTSFQFSLDISDATRQPHSEPGYANA